MRKKLVSMVLATTIMISVLGGCSGGSSETTASNDGDRPLILRLPTAVTSLDWGKSANTHDMKVCHQVFEGLYGMDEANNGYYKELAKDVVLSEDQKVYTITLQDGVKFQNGEDLKASDVVFSFKKALENPGINYLTSMLDKIEVVDEQTVAISIKYPYAPIEHTFFSVKIMSEKEVTEQGDKFGTIPHSAGTGPYYVQEYNIATGVKLKAFDQYWRGAPTIKDVEYRVLSDASAAVIAFENGELDYYEDAALSDWKSLEAAAGENSKMIKGNNILWMGINYSRNEILDNDKVREAIFYAVNKDDVNLAVSDGLGTTATQYMPSEYVSTSPDSGFETYEYNPEKSKTLLAEAGYPNGVDVGTILTAGASTGNSAKMAQVLQANLAAVGIISQVSVMDVSIVIEKWHEQDFDLLVSADSGNYDFNNIRQQIHSESVGMYCIKYKDGKFDWKRMEELMGLGVSTADIKERLGYYTELWSIVMDSATILPVLHTPVAVVWSKDLNIGDPVPTYYKIRNFSWKE